MEYFMFFPFEHYLTFVDWIIKSVNDSPFHSVIHNSLKDVLLKIVIKMWKNRFQNSMGCSLLDKDQM